MALSTTYTNTKKTESAAVSRSICPIDAAIYTRKLAKQEGIFAGNSCGAAVKGVLQLKENFTKDDVVVVLLHDSGSRYIGKIYNDDWMIKNNFSLD